jgi:FkbH-like protein
MDGDRHNCLIACDFTADSLAGLIANAATQPGVDVHALPPAQWRPLLDGQVSPSEGTQTVFLWGRPETLSAAFSRFLQYDDVAMDELYSDVDAFSDGVKRISERVPTVLVASLLIPPYVRGWGLLDLRNGCGVRNALMRMNMRLIDNLSKCSGVFILDASQWIKSGDTAWDASMWYLTKIPFSNSVFRLCGQDIQAALATIFGQTKKLVVLDLDDTLWGGIVGDVGWEQLRLGGHDPIGEAFVDFQKFLLTLKKRGILLAVVSKNEHLVAVEAMRRHPEMVLRLDDFVSLKINWNDKAQNIVEMLTELNLGAPSVVFLDDNPFERSRVREALPEILVPDLPENKLHYARFVASLSCFDMLNVSAEDRQRSQMYIAEQKRNELKRTTTLSPDEWLGSLNIRIQITQLLAEDFPRALQLLNKTNQMNLATRRFTESELTAWTKLASNRLWTIRVKDKFGDLGLVGVVGIAIDGTVARITDFVLSCRAFSRHVERIMLRLAADAAKSSGCLSVVARYEPTSKNKPCLEFFKRSGCMVVDEFVFSWNPLNIYPIPSGITVDGMTQ